MELFICAGIGVAAGSVDVAAQGRLFFDIAYNTALPYPCPMYTAIETDIFVRAAAQVWTDSERVAFIDWLAANPDAGDVIPGSGGCRKVRWTRPGMGKRGGARVIYFNRLESGEVVVDGVRESQIRQPARVIFETTARGH
ncbi:MAG: hypothetical protein Q7T65_07525 [Thiobacillus sp.]|nr:hypothetical protein [Thiobacillus sp.]